MNAIADLCNQWSEAWWLWVVQAGWQSAAVGLAVLVAVWAGWRLPSPVRHGLLVLALVKFAMPPLTTLPTGLFSRVTVGEVFQDEATALSSDTGGLPSSRSPQVSRPRRLFVGKKKAGCGAQSHVTRAET